jgi:hypothetical protein
MIIKDFAFIREKQMMRKGIQWDMFYWRRKLQEMKEKTNEYKMGTKRANA